MARKTSTVLLMMTGMFVFLVAVGGLGLIFISDYDAIEYEYEVTGKHDVFYESEGIPVSWNLNGTVSTIYMDIFGVTRITTTSDIGYFDAIEKTDKKYDLAGRWSFFSEPDFGTLTESIVGYVTVNYEEQDVDVYELTDGNEFTRRWVGQDDGIVYRVDRTIINDELETHIIQDLVSHKKTAMPFKI